MNRHTFLLISIIGVGFLLRLYRIDGPIADWHSWRQADTAAVTRNFDRFGFDPLRPRYDDLSNVQSGKDNPEGYRMVEFPLYNIVSYGVWKAGGMFNMSVELAHRIVSIAASLASTAFVYQIVSVYITKRAGLFAAFFYAVMPYAVYYSRVTLPEPFLVFCGLGMVWSFLKANSKQQIANRYVYVSISLVFGAAALLIKPTAIFYTAPVLVLWFIHNRLTFRSVAVFICFLSIQIIPLLFWRRWIEQFPEGIPGWQWLFNGRSYDQHGLLSKIWFLIGYDPEGIRYRPAFFRWMVWERLTKLILGYAGVGLFIAGTVTAIRHSRRYLVFIVWAVAMGLYTVVFAKGNVQHDYYQIIIIPVICMVLGIGADAVLAYAHSKKVDYAGYAIIGFATIAMVTISWKQVKGYYWINNPAIIEAGKAVDALVPQDAKVIAPYGGDTAFLYQTNRQGWPVGFDIEQKIEKGATYYVNVNVNDGETKYVMEKFTPVVVTDTYVIVQLP